MFNFEKLVNSTLFRYADLLFKIICVNIMVVIFSLPLITLLPALVAGYDRIKYYMEENEAPLFKSFIQAFRYNFYRHFKIGLAIIVLIGLMSLNIYSYYSQIENGVVYIIGLYVSLVLLFFIVLTVVNIPLSCIFFPQLNARKIMKISFYIGIKHVFVSVMMILSFSLTYLLILYAFPVYTFIGISLPIFINLKLATRLYKKYGKE